MADDRPNPWASLATSRKSIVAIGAIVMAGAVILFGMKTHADKEYVLGYVAAIGALAFKLVGAIATEDAARTTATSVVTAAKLASIRPPPDYNIPVSVPPPSAVPAEAARKEPTP